MFQFLYLRWLCLKITKSPQIQSGGICIPPDALVERRLLVAGVTSFHFRNATADGLLTFVNQDGATVADEQGGAFFLGHEGRDVGGTNVDLFAFGFATNEAHR